jgi:hypothetical protein
MIHAKRQCSILKRYPHCKFALTRKYLHWSAVSFSLYLVDHFVFTDRILAAVISISELLHLCAFLPKTESETRGQLEEGNEGVKKKRWKSRFFVLRKIGAVHTMDSCGRVAGKQRKMSKRMPWLSRHL